SVGSTAIVGGVGGKRPTERATARAPAAPIVRRLALCPPIRCLRLGCILQLSAPPAPQGVDPIEDPGRPSAPWACEPLAEAAKHRGRVGVAHEQASELALVIALDELDASCARNDAQLVEPTLVVLPHYGLDATTHDWLE